jgi:hypothetical protein
MELVIAGVERVRILCLSSFLFENQLRMDINYLLIWHNSLDILYMLSKLE